MGGSIEAALFSALRGRTAGQTEHQEHVADQSFAHQGPRGATARQRCPERTRQHEADNSRGNFATRKWTKQWLKVINVVTDFVLASRLLQDKLQSYAVTQVPVWFQPTGRISGLDP